MKITNAKVLPKVYFGLHMEPGVAEYRPPGANPYRVYIEETAIKNMDPTFQGRPVFVEHVDEVDLETIQKDADGYVIESFFNQKDGKHWCKFIVVSDRGHEAIRNGWKLSNCYQIKSSGGGGSWHGVDYAKEVVSGEYEHLAIVQNPRYENSVIMSPEQFKEYNNEKEIELKRLANNKEKKSMFNFFKRERVENSADLETTIVELPKSKKQMSISDILTKFDERLVNGYHCNGDEMVKLGDKHMSVSNLIEKHMALENEMSDMMKKKENSESEDLEKEKLKDKKNEDDGDMENESESEAEKAKEEVKDKADELKKKNEKENFDKLKNAQATAKKVEHLGEMSEDQVVRGKSRYGSK